MKLEVIAKDLKDIEIINNSKASRIEFCDNLKQGGYTQTYSNIEKAIEVSKLPVMCIVRHHSDNFQVTNDQLKLILKDIEFVSSQNGYGIVFGATNEDGTVNTDALRKVVSKSNGMNVTFHKAFDEVVDKKREASILKELGASRILTAGGKNSINENIDHMIQLSELIEVLPGGGVNFENASLFKKNGFTWIHVGTAVRENNSWDEPVSLEKIDKLYDLLNK